MMNARQLRILCRVRNQDQLVIEEAVSEWHVCGRLRRPKETKVHLPRLILTPPLSHSSILIRNQVFSICLHSAFLSDVSSGRKIVRMTFRQDGLPPLDVLSGLCLPGQIVARPTPVYTRIFSYYFSSNLFVVRLAKKVKYGIRKGFCRPSHPYFDKMCFFLKLKNV